MEGNGFRSDCLWKFESYLKQKGAESFTWLSEWFSKILRCAKMPYKWTLSRCSHSTSTKAISNTAPTEIKKHTPKVRGAMGDWEQNEKRHGHLSEPVLMLGRPSTKDPRLLEDDREKLRKDEELRVFFLTKRNPKRCPQVFSQVL